MAIWVWILIAIAIVAVIALFALTVSKRRTALLRERFGPEYDRALQERQDRRTAEATLRDREKQRAKFDIKPLPEDARQKFAAEWRQVQEHFVDEPAQAAAAADALLTRVMAARGYPMSDFEAQADLVSVDHPDVVENYRFAHGIQQRAQAQQASTEDLREALLRYRTLFGRLLQADGDQAVTAPAGDAAQEAADETETGHRPAAAAANQTADGAGAPATGTPAPSADAAVSSGGSTRRDGQATRGGAQ